MFFRKESKIQSRQSRLEELDKRNRAAKDALILERVRGQMIDLNNSLKRMERFWNRKSSEAGGEEVKAIAIYNSAKEAAINIGNNYSFIESQPFYKRIVENISKLDSQFSIRDVENLGELISLGKCVIAEDEQQRQCKIEELLGRLIDALMRMLSLGKIANVIACVDETEAIKLYP